MKKQSSNRSKPSEDSSSQPKLPLETVPIWQLITAGSFGLSFVTVLLFIAIFVPNPTIFQIFVFRVILSLSAGGVGAIIPGFLNVQFKGLVRAGGALALFTLVYLFNPPELITKSTSELISTSGPVSNTAPKTILELIEEFRDLLISWYSDNPEVSRAGNTEFDNPDMDPSLYSKLNDLVQKIDERSMTLRQDSIERARGEFYVSYWLDFQRRVLNRSERNKACIRTSSIYAKPIKSYEAFLKSGGKVKTRRDLFILIELGHWLTNRDGSKDDYKLEPHEAPDNPDIADGYKTALKLLNFVKNEDLERLDLEYDYYASRGLIHAKAEQFADALADLRHAKALEVEGSEQPELQYNLAAATSRHGNYDEGITLYEDLVDDEEKGFGEISPDIVYRDMGFNYMINGVRKDEKEETGTSGESDYKSALMKFNKIGIESRYHESASIGTILAYNQLKKPDSLISPEYKHISNNKNREALDELLEVGLKELSLNLFLRRLSHGAFILHGFEEDDLLEIFHEDFYCPPNVRRINVE
ncbi:MAG: tetratricopeptide repeat protein [Cyanobacteria bacterium P01_G01_bin.54]